MNVSLVKPFIMVKCKIAKSKIKVYENVHTTININKVKNKSKSFSSSKKPLNLLFIGIDSVSRLQFMRSMPKTWDFLNRDAWIEMKGYNKMGDNTFPNLMAAFTGMNESVAFKNCKPELVGMLDKCHFIWDDFRNHGYVTSYAEDTPKMATFNYLKRGFSNPPTDYYFRPYFIASEELNIVENANLNYCTGPESAGERVLNIAKDFVATFKENPNLGIFWMNSFSHNSINTVSGMDEKIRDFFKEIVYSGNAMNSVIIFLSDHGMRFGDFRHTPTGWYEERLPYLYFRLPKWFSNEFPEEYQNLQENGNKLISPFDLYMTLQDILVLSGLNFTKISSQGCPNCKSLFSKIPNDRDCLDVGISNHWCTCEVLSSVYINSKVVNKTVNLILDFIWYKILLQNPKCHKFKMKQIFYTKTSKSIRTSNISNLLIGFRTEPNADFEATVRFKDRDVKKLKVHNFKLQNGISRLDMYSEHSKCVNDSVLKKYCYCR